MDRRLFLQGFAAALAAGSVTGRPVLAAGDSWKADFAAALKRHPWLLGYKTAREDGYPLAELTVEGTIPDRLRGTLYRNGPARHEIGDTRYQHWFTGDGMVHAFRIHDGGASHFGRFVETEKFAAETHACRVLYDGFGSEFEGTLPIRNADQLNTANINVIWHGGELLALWEGGSAYRLDPETLETLGLKTWSAETKGLPFSAHPRVDRDGTLWNFGYASVFNALVIYRIGADGRLLDSHAIKMDAVPMVHDFMITEKHLILTLPPFVFNRRDDGAFLDQFDWRPEQGGRALVLDKNDLSSMREVELPPFWVFHFTNAFETGNDIAFQAPVYESPDVMTSAFRDVMRGAPASAAPSTLISARLDPAKGKFDFSEVSEGIGAEFPRIDNRQQGRRHRYSVMMQNRRNPDRLTFDTVARFDHDGGATDSYSYSAGEMAEEHIFVPDPATEDESTGWVLGTSLNPATAITSLNIFEAGNVAAGPVARLHTTHAIPLGLHGDFVPA